MHACSGLASYGALGHMPLSTSNNFTFSSLWRKSHSQLSKYCVVCEISWCRCQQLTAFSISTALVTKLLVIHRAAPGPEVCRECPTTKLSNRHQIKVKVRVSSRVRVAVRFGTLSKFPALPLLATNPGDTTDACVCIVCNLEFLDLYHQE